MICSECIKKGVKKEATHLIEINFYYAGIPAKAQKALCNSCANECNKERFK